jgi:hypothetical protein
LWEFHLASRQLKGDYVKLISFGRCLSLFAVIIWLATETAQAQSCPNLPPVNISSAVIPKDVCIPSGFQDIPIRFFDDFSWRSFIALVWPALSPQRGQPDTRLQVGGAGPRVFETYKTLHELFHDDGSSPGAWNDYDAPSFNACQAKLAFGDLALASFSKFSNLGEAGFGELVGPIVAQNRTYVRYETSFNESLYDQIVKSQWYLRSKLPQMITFNNGSIDIKSSWIDMTNVAHPERYYTRVAWVLDPATGNCAKTTVGLVGLHIVQKTPTRPQWIWSTFEQVDTVPPKQNDGPNTFGFNDGKGTPMPPANPFVLNPLALPTPPPFNITRTFPIHASTQATNLAYRNALKGTPWQFYQLVMTQWPIPASQPGINGAPGNTFPGRGATTAFSNTTLETFDQGSISTGCMACHNLTMSATDFVWSLADHAFPTEVPGLLVANKAFKQLQNLMTEFPHTQAMAAQKKIMQQVQSQSKAK